MITEQELTEIQQRLDSISPAPWRSFIEGRDMESGSSFIMVGEGENRKEDFEILGISEADQDFIAASRQDIPKLLEEVARLKRLVSSLTK